MPRLELGLDALAGPAAQQVPIPEAEPVELRTVCAIEPGELSLQLVRLEQPGLELPERPEQLVGEAAEAGGGGEAVERHRPEHAADEQRALRLRDEGAGVVPRICDALEHVVEGVDRAAEERRPALEQLPRDALDVRPVRHDEHRLPVEGGQIAVEQKLDLARVRGAGDQAERHRSIVERGADGSR